VPVHRVSKPSTGSRITQRRETRDIGEVIRVEGNQGRPVHQSLGGNHPVEQLPPRVASASDNGPIGLRRKIIERQSWNSAQHGVEPRPANRRLRRLPTDAALQLDAEIRTARPRVPPALRDHGVAIAGGILQMMASLHSPRAAAYATLKEGMPETSTRLSACQRS